MQKLMRAGRGRIALFAAIIALLLVSGGFTPNTEGDYFFKINKSIDIFGQVYKEIASNYVDEVDPEKFMRAGIDGMLGTLDPYTVFIAKEEGDEVELLTNGKYGGIGVTIGSREGAIQVVTVMDGYSAQRAGIIPGDKILEVDGVKVENKKPDEVRSLTRGEPGTEVRVLVEREGEKKPLMFVLIREEIQLKNVTYFELRDNNIAYIRLERFSRRAGDEVRQAIKEMKLKGEIKGVVLDLRGNPGGLLDAAVDVVSKFIPKGSVIVTTRGRRPETEKHYASVEEPLLPGAPLVVLVDRGSASASEIVAGSLQDLDRAIVVGTRSFGKGLVQTVQRLSYDAQIKITTARYYIPSGRSIQEIDYMHKDGNGVFATVPDSLKRAFKTKGGRTVYEYGGISPDSAVQAEETGPMIRELNRKSLFFKFANKYFSDHRNEPFAGVTPAILNQFKTYIEEQKFDYKEESEGKIKELHQIAERSHYSKEVLNDLDLLMSALEKEKDRGFERYKDHIERELNAEMMARVKGEAGRIAESLAGDKQLDVALQIVRSPAMYSKKMVGH
ncbi:MAG: S41 family peptidase [Ignavibacteriae bacterium]|nr:S41 family peptidase [Ignavibacteriota bacterium]